MGSRMRRVEEGRAETKGVKDYNRDREEKEKKERK